MFLQVSFMIQGSQHTQVSIGLVRTNGSRFAWTHHSPGGFMIGLNLIPHHFGLALDVQWSRCTIEEHARELGAIIEWRLRQKKAVYP